MKASTTLIKALIPIAPSAEEADKLIVENFGFETIPEKIAFLKGMYGVEVFAREDGHSTTSEESIEQDYWAMLAAVMNG